jgi:rhamnosyl/mannosyltransferase
MFEVRPSPRPGEPRRITRATPPTDLVIGGYERQVLPRVFARAGALVAVSPVSLATAWPGALSISPGVDLDRFTPGPPPSQRPPTVVYAGRMDRTSAWKGVDVLLHAFAALAPGMPGARLRLIGGGDAMAGHRALADRLGIADRLDLPGELTGDDLSDALRSAALLVLPSRTAAESFGMVLAEAMACGTPVIGSRIGGIPYLITHRATGLLVPPTTPPPSPTPAPSSSPVPPCPTPWARPAAATWRSTTPGPS